jgi:hypothetical protein
MTITTIKYIILLYRWKLHKTRMHGFTLRKQFIISKYNRLRVNIGHISSKIQLSLISYLPHHNTQLICKAYN